MQSHCVTSSELFFKQIADRHTQNEVHSWGFLMPILPCHETCCQFPGCVHGHNFRRWYHQGTPSDGEDHGTSLCYLCNFAWVYNYFKTKECFKLLPNFHLAREMNFWCLQLVAFPQSRFLLGNWPSLWGSADAWGGHNLLPDKEQQSTPRTLHRGCITCPSPGTGLSTSLPLKSLRRNRSQLVEEEFQLPLVAFSSLNKTNAPGDRMKQGHGSSVEVVNRAPHLAAALGCLLMCQCRVWSRADCRNAGFQGGDVQQRERAKWACPEEQGQFRAEVQELAGPLSSGGLFTWLPRKSTLCKLPWTTRNRSRNKTPLGRTAGR